MPPGAERVRALEQKLAERQAKIMKPAVMLPTYNEAENLRKITESILRAAPEMTVVIVDDESPDGTGRSPTSSPAPRTASA